MIEEKVKKTIKDRGLIEKGDHVVLGLSGGPDSVCLFDMLCSMSGEMGFSLSAVHVNHKFRPGDAERDRDYVKKICRERGVPCDVYEVDCHRVAEDLGMTDEEAGRKVRYDSYEKSAAASSETKRISKEKVKIAVAQNMNDQAETVLFRIIRGTGVDGLSPMGFKRKRESGFWVIRPLLDVDRRDIEAYCLEKRLEPCRDKTNKDTLYTRNKIRLELIPYLEREFNGSVMERLCTLADLAEKDRDHIGRVVDEIFESLIKDKNTDRVILDREGFSGLHEALKHRIVMKAFGEIGLDEDLSYVHVGICCRLIEEGRGTCSVDMPHGYRMEVRYGDVVFGRDRETGEGGGAERPDLYKKLVPFEEYCHDSSVAALDYDRFLEEFGDEEIQWRTRQPGDRIQLPATEGGKKIKKLFIDEKVPKDLRDSIYMAAVGHEIIWIPKGRTRAFYRGDLKVTEATKRVLLLDTKEIL